MAKTKRWMQWMQKLQKLWKPSDKVRQTMKETRASKEQRLTTEIDKTNQQVRLQFPHIGQQHPNQKWQHKNRSTSSTLRYKYSTSLLPPTNTTTNGDLYEPPANDSIIQGARSAPGGHFMTNTTGTMGRNELWRYNNGANTATHTNPQGRRTRPTSHSGFHNNSPNSTHNRNKPTCFKCGEQGHMRMDCRERDFCTHCRTVNHSKACRKHHINAPSPTSSHIPAGYHPTATPPPLMGQAATTQQTHQTGAHNNQQLFPNLFENNQPRTRTTTHTPFNGASPAPSAN